MTGSRVALVADDQDLARAIQHHLEKDANPLVFSCSFARIHDFLDGHADGLLLIAAAHNLEAASAVRLVQDISLQKLPPVVVLLDSTPVENPQLAGLDRYVSRRLRWPEDAAHLTQVVKELGRAGEFPLG